MLEQEAMVSCLQLWCKLHNDLAVAWKHSGLHELWLIGMFWICQLSQLMGIMIFRAVDGFEVWLSLLRADWGLPLSEWVIKECKFWWGGEGGGLGAGGGGAGDSFRQSLISTFIWWNYSWWRITEERWAKKTKWANSWGCDTEFSFEKLPRIMRRYSSTKRDDLIIWRAIEIHPNHFQNVNKHYTNINKY